MDGAPTPEQLSSSHLSAQAGTIKVQYSSHHCHITAYLCVLNEFLILLLQWNRGFVDHVALAQTLAKYSLFFESQRQAGM